MCAYIYNKNTFGNIQKKEPVNDRLPLEKGNQVATKQRWENSFTLFEDFFPLIFLSFKTSEI